MADVSSSKRKRADPFAGLFVNRDPFGGIGKVFAAQRTFDRMIASQTFTMKALAGVQLPGVLPPKVPSALRAGYQASASGPLAAGPVVGRRPLVGVSAMGAGSNVAKMVLDGVSAEISSTNRLATQLAGVGSGSSQLSAAMFPKASPAATVGDQIACGAFGSRTKLLEGLASIPKSADLFPKSETGLFSTMSATQRLVEQLVGVNVGSKLAAGAMYPTVSATQRLAEQLAGVNFGAKLPTAGLFPTVSATQRLAEQLAGVNFRAKLPTAGLFPMGETAAFREFSAVQTLVRQLTSADHGAKLLSVGPFPKPTPPAGLGVGQVSRFWGALPVIDWGGLAGPQVAVIPLAPLPASAVEVVAGVTREEVESMLRAELLAERAELGAPAAPYVRGSTRALWFIGGAWISDEALHLLLHELASDVSSNLVFVIWLLLACSYRQTLSRAWGLLDAC